MVYTNDVMIMINGRIDLLNISINISPLSSVNHDFAKSKQYFRKPHQMTAVRQYGD